MKRKPTGYVAVCQCGFVVGAMDKDRTASDEAGRLLGRWLSSGCTVKPMFDHSWRAQVEQCQCDDAAVQQPAQAAADARDAGRYRWLREQDWFSGPLCVLREPKRVLMRGIGLGADCPSGDRLDAAIDAALATHQQGGAA